MENNPFSFPETCWWQISLMLWLWFEEIAYQIIRLLWRMSIIFAKCSAINNLNIQDLDGKDLSKIILWNNKFICLGDKSLYFRNLSEKGILRVGDLISNKNELIIKSELRVLHLSPFDAFRLVFLIDSLPTHWRVSLKTCISTGDTPFNLRDEIKLRLSGQIVLLEKAYSKIVYKELRNVIVTPPTAKLKVNAH